MSQESVNQMGATRDSIAGRLCLDHNIVNITPREVTIGNQETY